MSDKIQDTKSAAIVPEENGGPAFPGTWMDRDSMGEIVPREFFPGMTLRAIIDVNRENMKISFEGEAEQAVKYADALIAALKAVQP